MEVMVAVVIISVVIAALLEMSGNSHKIFSKVKEDSKVVQLASFLIGSTKYGFTNETLTLDKLADGFDLDFDARKSLKQEKVKLIYTKLQQIDMSEYDDNTSQEQSSSSMVFEIGKTTLRFHSESTSLLRLRLQ